MNPQQLAMIRMLLQQPAVRDPNNPSERSGGVDTGKDYNTARTPWFTPNYTQRNQRGGGRVTTQMNQNDIIEQRGRSIRQDELTNAMRWRHNQPPSDLAGQVLSRRPQDAVAGIPTFANTGIDEQYQAFKNYLKFGTTSPGFDPYYGNAKGYA